MRAGQVGTRIREDLPPGRLELVHALKKLYSCLGSCTQAGTALRLTEKGHTVTKGQISRYLNGNMLPNAKFVEALYDLAVATAGNNPGGMTRQQVLSLHGSAEPTRCGTCRQTRQRNRVLAKENEELKAAEAGLRAQLTTAQRRETPLPVPRRERDRQRRSSDVRAARQIAKQAASLQDAGDPGAALAMLLDTVGTLTPVEGAMSAKILRAEKRDQLADTLLHVYGRERREGDVLWMALKLHEQGLMNDVAVVLRAATSQARTDTGV
ncbi:hypothetical protein ACWGDX_09515 [Streptomyces sp. NPDC055025]